MAQGDRQVLEQWIIQRDPAAFQHITHRYAGMIHAACRRVLGGNEDAEEITQECFEYLAQAQDLPDTPFLGPWLYGIATKKALAQRRSNTRRELREAKYADSLAQSVEPAWNDVAHYVDDAIGELPEDLRLPLLAHFFQGESHGAIANTMGIPRRTVSNRIARGVHMVGVTLKRRGVTASTATLWALFTANLAEASPLPAKLTALIDKTLAAHAGQPATQAAATVGVRALIVKFSIGMAIIGGAGGLWWTIQEGTNGASGNTPRTIGEETAIPDPIIVAEAAQGADTGAQASVSDNNRDSAASEAAKGDALIIVQVVDRNATPQSGAQVTLQLWNNPEESDPFAGLVTLNGVTNAEGEVTFDRVAEKSFAATAKTDGFAGYGWIEGNIYSRVRLVLRPTEKTAIRVSDAAGRPVEGARAFISETRPKSQRKFSPGRLVMLGSTGPDGRLELAIPAGQTWRLQFIAEHHASAILDSVTGGSEYEAELVEGFSLAGVLRDESGLPVEAAVLEAESTEYPLDRRSIETDESGRFTLANLASGEYAVSLKSDTVTLAGHEIVIGPAATGRSPLELTAIDGAELSGLVRTKNSRLSVASARVSLTRQVGDRWFQESAMTDDNGRYAFKGLAPGSYRVNLSDAGAHSIFGQDSTEEITLGSGESRLDVHFGVGESPAVTAKVEGSVTYQGKPAPAFVTANPGGFYCVETVRTDNRGRFQFDGLPSIRDLRLQAFRPGLASEEPMPIVLPPEGLSGAALELHPTGTVSGRVVNASGRAFKSDEHYVDFMNSWHARGTMHSTCIVLTDGRFRIPDMPIGKYRLAIEQLDPGMMSTGIRNPDGSVQVAPGQQIEDIVITIDDTRGRRSMSKAERNAEFDRMSRDSQEREQRAWGVKGRVVSARTGDPVSNYFVTAFRMSETRQDVADDDGRFNYPPKDVKRVVIRIEAHGYQPSKTFVWPVELRDRYAEIEIRLDPSPVVEGVVQDSQGNPVFGARIYPEKLPSEHQSEHARFPVTKEDGRFRLNTLEPKPQQIFVERIGYTITTVDVTPVLGRPTSLVVILPPGARIEGSVTENGSPLSNTRVSGYAIAHWARQPGVQTDEDGAYTLDHIARGMVRVIASFPRDDARPNDYRYQIREIQVIGDETIRADFDFRTRTNVLEGSVTLNGEMPRSASVRAYTEFGDTKESFSSSPFANGVYRLDPLPPGKAIVTATVRTPGADTSLKKTTELMLSENETMTLDFEFTGSGVVQGTLHNTSPGEPITILAIPGKAPILRDAALTASGLVTEGYYARGQARDSAYVLEALPPGTYTIQAVSTDRHLFDPNNPRITAGTVTITENEQVELNLSF